MAEMGEGRLEALLRETLKVEVASLPVTLRPTDVLEQRRLRRSSGSRARLRLLGLAALLVLPAAAVLLVGLQPDEGEGYRAVLVRGLDLDHERGTVSDLEIVLAGPDGVVDPWVRIAADRLDGRVHAGPPQLSPTGRWLALHLGSADTGTEALAVVDLHAPEAEPLVLDGSSIVGWGSDDLLWRSPNGPQQRIEPATRTVQPIDEALPDGLVPWPFEGRRLPVAADGSGFVVLDTETGFRPASPQATWAVVGPGGLSRPDEAYPRLVEDASIRLLDERAGLLQVCDSIPESSAFCPDRARGTVISTGADGLVSEWRAAPSSDESVLSASWAADGGVWLLLDRRSPDGRTIALVDVAPDGSVSDEAAVAVAHRGSIEIQALAPDDSLIAVAWVDGAGYQTALLEPRSGRGWLHHGQAAGFVKSVPAASPVSAGQSAEPGAPLPASPLPGQSGYAPLPPLEEQVPPTENVLAQHEASALLGVDGPGPVVLGPIEIEEGYGISLVCSGPGDVRYTEQYMSADAFGSDWAEDVVVHCQVGGPDDRSAPAVTGGTLTVTVQPDADTAWRLLVYDPPPYRSHRAPATSDPSLD